MKGVFGETAIRVSQKKRKKYANDGNLNLERVFQSELVEKKIA